MVNFDLQTADEKRKLHASRCHLRTILWDRGMRLPLQALILSYMFYAYHWCPANAESSASPCQHTSLSTCTILRLVKSRWVILIVCISFQDHMSYLCGSVCHQTVVKTPVRKTASPPPLNRRPCLPSIQCHSSAATLWELQTC
ncbi:hypothetical protein C8Q74DRAFT_568081 [Fomes fomentarius]|nr:hypothetical protein C8Q74DRAFT_568081 [Fomes fomentarius]